MNEKIKEIRMGKGASFIETEIDLETLLGYEFTDSDGKSITVMLRHGKVEVSARDGRLIVTPNAANSISVTAETL